MSESIVFTASRKAFNLLVPNTKSKLFKKFEDAISLVSGGSIEEFFHYLISNTKLGREYLIPVATRFLLEPVMLRTLLLYENTPVNKKIHILSIVSDFTPSVLKSYGFNFSQSQLERSQVIAKEGKATLIDYIRTMPGLRQPITGIQKSQIMECLMENSFISSYTCQKKINEQKNKLKKKKNAKKIIYNMKTITMKKYIF